MRVGSCGTRMVRPNSSTTSRMAGEAVVEEGADVTDWARRGKALSKSKIELKTRARRMVLAEQCCTNLP